MIVFKPSNESLGVIITSSNSSNGFVIAHIDPGSVIDRDGRFRPGDRIVKINGHDLVELNISQVREILRHSGNQVKISVVRPHSEHNIKIPRTNLNKSESLRIFRAVSNSHKLQDKTSSPMVRNKNSILASHKTENDNVKPTDWINTKAGNNSCCLYVIT